MIPPNIFWKRIFILQCRIKELTFFLFSLFSLLHFYIQGQSFWLLKRHDYKDSAIVLIAISTSAGYCFWCYRGNTSNYVKYYRRNLRVPELQLSTLVSTIQFSAGTSHTTPLDYIVCKVPGTCSLQVSRECGKSGIANHVTRIMLSYQPWHSSWM